MDKKKLLTISTDSTADLTCEQYDHYKIQVLPLGVFVKDKLHFDGVDITPEDVMTSVEKHNVMPKSNAANEAEYTELFEKNKKSDVHIHISISNKLSASQRAARAAAENFPNVTVIDSKVLSSGTGLLCIIARELEKNGYHPDKIIEKLNEYAGKGQTSFVLDSLRYLHKGGRVSGLKLLGANLLKIHPELRCDEEGNLVQGKKFKGNFKKVTQEYTKHIISSHPNANKDLVMLTYTKMSDPSIVADMERELLAAGFKRVLHSNAGAVITCHCGPNTIGILFVNE